MSGNKPVILDANVLKDIAGGNTNAGWALRRRLGRTRVYIARVAYRQLVIDAPTKEAGDHWRQVLRDTKIKIAPKSPMGARVDLHEANIATQDFPMKLDHPTGGMQQYRRKGGAEIFDKPGDAFIAAEAKSLKAELWTHDADFAKKAAQHGVALAQEANLKGKIPRGPEDIGRAREYLGLDKPRLLQRINLKARVVNLVSSTRAVGGAVMGGVKATGRVLGGAIRSPVGNVIVSTALVVGQIFLERWMTKRMMENKIRDGLNAAAAKADQKLNALKPDIAKLQLKTDRGERIFANITIEIHTYTWSRPSAKGGGKYNDWEVWLADVNISTQNITLDHTYTAERYHAGNNANVPREINKRVESFDVEVYSQEELELFRDLQAEYLEKKRLAAMDPYDNLAAYELDRLREEIVAAFGSDVWFLAR